MLASIFLFFFTKIRHLNSVSRSKTKPDLAFRAKYLSYKKRVFNAISTLLNLYALISTLDCHTVTSLIPHLVIKLKLFICHHVMCLQILMDKGFRHVVQSCPNLGNFLIFCIMWHRQRFMSFHFLRKWIMKDISQLLRNCPWSLLSFLRSGGKKCKKMKRKDSFSISDSFAMRYNLLKGSSG